MNSPSKGIYPPIGIFYYFDEILKNVAHGLVISKSMPGHVLTIDLCLDRKTAYRDVSFHHYVTIEISYNFHALQKLIINASSYEDKQGINMSLLRINCSKTCNLSLEINWISMMQSCVWQKSIYQGHHRTTISHGMLTKKYLYLFLYDSTNYNSCFFESIYFCNDKILIFDLKDYNKSLPKMTLD